MSDVRTYNLTIDLCLRVGEMLMSSGAGAEDVSEAMMAIAQHYDLRRPEIDVTFTSLSVSYQYAADEPQLVQIRMVKQRDIDYEDLAQTDQLVGDILRDRVTLIEARTQIARIAASDHSRPRWVVTAAKAVMCAGTALSLGGTIHVIGTAALAAVAIDRTQMLMDRNYWPVFYQQVVGGMIASLFAVGAGLLGLDIVESRSVTANIIMLLAGIGFMGALQDALSGYYVTAGARITEAMMSTAGIIGGVSGGLTIGRLLGFEVSDLQPGATSIQAVTMIAVGAALTSAAFAVATYAPVRSWLPIAVLSVVTTEVYYLVYAVQFSKPWAAAAAAFVVGVVSYSVSGRVRVPPLVVVVSAIVPILPGLSIYRGLSLLAEGGTDVSEGLLALITAATVAVALSSGVILGEYVATPLKRNARRIEVQIGSRVPRMVGTWWRDIDQK